MNEKLQLLIERARNYQMSVREREEQIRSFAYGNTSLENSSITMADIEEAMTAMGEFGNRSFPEDATRL